MFCINCEDELEFHDSVSICGKEACVQFRYSIYIEGDDYVSKYIIRSKDSGIRILGIAESAIKANKYDPCPVTLNKDELKTLFQTNTPYGIITSIVGKTDEDIVKTVGSTLYGFIKFSFYKFMFGIMENTVKQGKIEITEVQTSQDFVKSLGSNFCYRFHGTAKGNLWSIMCNGIKNMSHTTGMVNGAAHGPGIYLSNDCSLSIGYIRDKYSYTQHHGKIILMVYILNNDPSYKKTNNIFVIPDEKQLQLNYLIEIDLSKMGHSEMTTLYRELNDKYGTGLREDKKREQGHRKKIHNKRLMIEYKEAMENTDPDFEYIIDEDNISVWRVRIRNFGEDTELHQDLMKIGRDYVEIEIRFPDNFPIKAPYIWVVAPIFQYRTGHVISGLDGGTTGGAICMDVLTDESWSPIMKIYAVLVQAKMVMSRGTEDDPVGSQGRIDMRMVGHEYTYEGSITGFKRLLSVHGWKN